MRLSYRPLGKRNDPHALLAAQTLELGKTAQKHWPPRGKGVFQRLTGRLVELKFAFSAPCAGPCEGFMQFTESEVFMLASLCRRGRTDDELLNAILRAEQGQPEGRKQRRVTPD